MEAECRPGGADETHLFNAHFLMQLCRVTTEHSAPGVNTFVIAKIYLICPGFGDI